MKSRSSAAIGSPASSPPTAIYIGYHAALRPGDVAVVVDGQEITYSEFHRDIGKMVAVLNRLGLAPGQAAGVNVSFCAFACAGPSSAPATSISDVIDRECTDNVIVGLPG